MQAEFYVLETLEIELNRLRYEDRSMVHYSSRNENGPVVKDRWERIRAFEKAITYHKKLIEEGRSWCDGNPFNGVDNFWD